MASSNDPIHDAVMQFVTDSNRLGYTSQEVANELEELGRNVSSQWPRASATHWARVIRECIEAGLLREVDGKLTLPPPEATDKQLELFQS